MKTPGVKKTNFFRGSGYLAGFFIGTIAAVLFVAITGVEALIGAIAASVSIPAGMVLEHKIQGKNAPKKTGAGKFLILFLVLGIVLLIVAILFSF